MKRIVQKLSDGTHRFKDATPEERLDLVKKQAVSVSNAFKKVGEASFAGSIRKELDNAIAKAAIALKKKDSVAYKQSFDFLVNARKKATAKAEGLNPQFKAIVLKETLALTSTLRNLSGASKKAFKSEKSQAAHKEAVGGNLDVKAEYQSKMKAKYGDTVLIKQKGKEVEVYFATKRIGGTFHHGPQDYKTERAYQEASRLYEGLRRDIGPKSILVSSPLKIGKFPSNVAAFVGRFALKTRKPVKK